MDATVRNFLKSIDVHHRSQVSPFKPLEFLSMLGALFFIHLDKEQKHQKHTIHENHAPYQQGLIGKDPEHERMLNTNVPSDNACLQDQEIPGLSQALQRFAEWPDDYRQTMDSFVQSFDLNTQQGRGRALRALDLILGRYQQQYPGEICTPPQAVADLMTGIVSPQPGEHIYDPCFGFGGLLLACGRYVLDRRDPTYWRKNGLQNHVRLYGLEVNQEACLLASVRFALNGIDFRNLVNQSILEDSRTSLENASGYDVGLAIPPWGYHFTEDQKDQDTQISEVLFVKYLIRALKPGGRGIIAVPDTFLSLPAYGSIRSEIFEDCSFQGVLSLPSGAFRPWSNRKISLLALNKRQPEKRQAQHDLVRFSILSEELLRRETASSTFDEDRYTRFISETVRKFQGEIADESSWERSVETVKKFNMDLLPEQNPEEKLIEILNKLKNIAPDIDIAPLKQVADIIPGTNINTSRLTEMPDEEQEAIGYLRLSDLQEIDGEYVAQQPSLYLNQSNKNDVYEEMYVHQGDTLLAVSNKWCRFVSNNNLFENQKHLSYVKVIPDNDFIIFRSKSDRKKNFAESSIEYLNYYNFLIKCGISIPNLIKEIKNVKIPVDIYWSSIDDYYLFQLNKYLKSDRKDFSIIENISLTYFYEFLLNRDNYPLNLYLWLKNSKKIQNILNNKVIENKTGQLFDTIYKDFLQYIFGKNDNTSEIISDEIIFLEKTLHGILKNLSAITPVPEGPVRFFLYDNAKKEISGILEKKLNDFKIKSEKIILHDSRIEIISEMVWNLMNYFSKLIHREQQKMLETVSIHCWLSPEYVFPRQKNILTLYVQNTGVLPLRNLVLTTIPDFGDALIPYLGEKQQTQCNLSINPQNETNEFDMKVYWEGQDLDGKAIFGSIPMLIEVKSAQEIPETSKKLIHFEHNPKVLQIQENDPPEFKFGTSPYIVGSPVEQENMFFGRTDVIAGIKRQLSSHQKANVILLEGNRRTGKTSILKQLEKKHVLPDWIVINCSFQSGEGQAGGLPTKEVFRIMARHIGMKAYNAGVQTWFADLPGPDEKKPFKPQFIHALRRAFETEYPAEAFELYVQTVIDAVKPKRLLLMLDEFDKLQEGIDAGITSPSVLENIRYLLHTYDFSAILSGSRRIKRLREEYWSALFGLGHRIGISSLPQGEAQALVSKPVEGLLFYIPEARDRVVELCSAHPFLIQSLCTRIFEIAASRVQSTITLELVQQAAQEMISDNEHFRTLWDYAATENKRFLLSVCTRFSDGPDLVTIYFLEEKLAQEQIHLDREDLSNDIDFLLELELLGRDASLSQAVYRINIPLMAMWIKKHIDHAEQRNRAIRELKEQS